MKVYIVKPYNLPTFKMLVFSSIKTFEQYLKDQGYLFKTNAVKSVLGNFSEYTCHKRCQTEEYFFKVIEKEVDEVLIPKQSDSKKSY